MKLPMASVRKHNASSWQGADQKSGVARGLDSARAAADAPAQIWRSRLSWRIVLVVFLTILCVQAFMMCFTIKDYERARLNDLADTGRSAIVPLLAESVKNFYTSPVTAEQGRRLTTTTHVNGVAIYSGADLGLLGKYGAPLVLSLLNAQHLPASYRSGDGNFYEVVFKPDQLGRPYYIVAQLDSSRVAHQVQSYVTQTILIMLLMSAFVTTVLMIALGRWLLEPIFFLRASLQRAAEEPEKPRLTASPFDIRDEIGGAIDLAQKLIRQNAENITRIRGAAADQIHQLAYFDTLTGLPNRTQFLQNLTELAHEPAAGRKFSSVAVVTLDLDHFKDFNDSMGHEVGDALLRAVGKRLRASMPDAAFIARLGEDEFAITMPLAGNSLTARDVGERVAGIIRSEPFLLFNENFQVRASIGVSTWPRDGSDPDDVLKNADIALNRAREDGHDMVKEYSENFDRTVQQRFQLLRDLRDALEHEQLSLHYQPQLDLKTGKVIGAEALLRWWKPDASKEGGAFIPPAEFIPVAEQSGLIVPIGEMVLRVACEAAVGWQRAGYPIRIAVNVSGAQFYQSDLVAYVKKVLKETGLAPQSLELEVTESIFMEDVNHAIGVLQHLHAMGVELAIDDFGTGYSSLSYLRQFPIDRLKIDQSFIRNALNNPDDAAIARTIVRLGHSLNLKVIAEGVETREHERFLLEEGCDEVQGYRYSRPVPLEKFVAFLEAYDGNLSGFG